MPFAVPEEIARRGVLGKGLDGLLGGPLGTGTRGHVEVYDSSTIVRQDEQDEKHPERRRGTAKKSIETRSLT